MKATDGLVGHCKDILFDDDSWGIRYLDVNTGGWLSGRRVLLSPINLEPPNWLHKTIPTPLTRDQIENSPGLATDIPVSRQWEASFYDYYNSPHFTTSGGYLWGYTHHNPHDYQKEAIDELFRQKGFDSHLRSINELKGYKIKSIDDEFGSIRDFLFDDDVWVIKYVVAETVKWIPSKHILIPPEAIETFNWSEELVEVDLRKELIKEAPEFESVEFVDPFYETQVHNFFNQTSSSHNQGSLFS